MFYGKTYERKLHDTFLPYIDYTAPLFKIRLVEGAPEEAKQALKKYIEWKKNQPPTPTNEDGMPLKMDL